MCLAIYKPRDKEIPEDYLRNGFLENPDGAGFAVANRGRLFISKGYFVVDELIEDFKRHAHLPALVHFRFATHGCINEDNCHPFLFNRGKHAVIHNGVLNCPSTEEKSDTRHFVEYVLHPTAHVIEHSNTRKYIEGFIGPGNKIAVLSHEGHAIIFNEKYGHWKKGVWYSNDSYNDNRWWNWRQYKGFAPDRLPEKSHSRFPDWPEEIDEDAQKYIEEYL